MRLIKAEITGFGHFRNQTFSFQAGNQLFYGKNEVGKSTLYQFIQAMLFGFPKKSSRRRDYTPKDGTAYGGKLWLEIESHGEVYIERFRQINRGRAKVWVDDRVGDERLLESLLSPLNLQVFQEVFTFQQEQLAQIDRLQEGELHASLLSLGISGSNQLMNKIQEYQKENRLLYKQKGQRLPLNQQLKNYQKLIQKIAEKERYETTIKAAYKSLSEKDQQETELQKSRQKLQKEEQLLNQQKINWPLYEEWQQLDAVRENKISGAEKDKLQGFYQEYQHLTDEIQKKSDELARLEQGQESDSYFFFLDKEGKINELLRQKVDLVRREDQIQQLIEQLQDYEERLIVIRKKWGWAENQVPQSMGTTIYPILDHIEELEKQKNESKLHIDWIEEKRRTIEKDIDHLEKKHPELLKNQKPAKNFWLLFLAGFVTYFVVSLIFKLPKKSLMIVLPVCLLAAGWTLYMKKRGKKAQAFPIWQAHLAQLDSLAQEAAEEVAKAKKIEAEQTHAIQQIQAFFAGNKDYLQWRRLVRSYDEETISYQELHAKQHQLQKRLAELTDLQDRFVKELQEFSDWLPLANKSVSEQIESLETFAEKMQAKKMTRLQQPSTLLAQQAKQLKEERTKLVTNHEALLKRVGLASPSEIPAWMRHWERQLKLGARKEELTQTIMPLFPDPINREMLTERIKNNQWQQAQLHQEATDLSEEKQRIEVLIDQLQADGTLDECYQEKSRLLSEINELALTWSKNQIMSHFLTDLATELSDQQLPQLLERASHYLNILTSGRYVKVTFAEGILQVTDQKVTLDVYSLSTGTKDQLIMAIRFAYLSLQDQAVSPVVIDDGWLHYDAQRKQELARLFVEFGKKYQVICLSSDEEMVSYYQGLNQRVHEIKQRM